MRSMAARPRRSHGWRRSDDERCECAGPGLGQAIRASRVLSQSGDAAVVVASAIFPEPLVGLLREPFEDPIVDILAPSWCAPVYARMRGIRRIVETPYGHGKFDLASRRKLAREFKAEGYTRAFILPNSWKS